MSRDCGTLVAVSASSFVHLDYAVVHNSNKEVIIQARGRYRGDIDTLYHLDDGENHDGLAMEVDDSILDPYLGIRLDKSMKDSLRKELDIRDERDRLIGWSKLSGILRENNYLVAEKKSGSSRYSMIIKKADGADEQ